MKITAQGLRIIKDYEGLSLEAYQCPAGLWTIGYGHTASARPGQKISESRAIKLLNEDVRQFEKEVATLVNVPLTDNMFSALVSFTFNLGSKNLAGSTLLRALNKRLYDTAGREFLRWIHANGKPLRGLLRRRVRERELFFTPDF